MADLLQILQNRRSVRQYTGEEIPSDKLEKILQAGLLSPSGRRSCPWEFIVVRNKETLQIMSECRDGSAKMLDGADCAIVVLGNSDKTDTIIEDCSIAMSNMHLMADSLGVGSCWIQGRMRFAPDGRTTEEYLRSFLGFPKEYRLEAILSLGMPKGHKDPQSLEDLYYTKIHEEKF